MAEIKCKYCGGNVSAFPDNALGICSGCGATMTLPAVQDPKRIAAHNAGNYFRRAGDYDKALALYQGILKQDELDAEASWGSALCRFGVEYVPGENGFVPVCHRADAGSFPDCGDYLAAIAHSQGAVQLQYEKEAARIAHMVSPAAPLPPVNKPDASQLIKQAFRHLRNQDWSRADYCCDQAIALEPKNAMAYLGKLLAEQKCREPKELAQCSVPFDRSEHFRALMEVADPQLAQTMGACLHRIEKRGKMAQIADFYQKQVAAMEAATRESQLHQIARAFAKLGGYQDSQERAQECLRRAEVLRRDSIYHSALSAQENAETEDDFRSAAALFAKIPGWRDANVRHVDCQNKADAFEAMHSEHTKAEGWLRLIVGIAAVVLLLGAGGYLLFTQYIIPQRAYDAAEALLTVNEKEAAIAAFQALGGFKDSEERAMNIQESWYAEAEMLLAASDHRRAAAAFGGLGDFADARERSMRLWDEIVTPDSISAGGWYTVGIFNSRTAAAVGSNHEKQCNVGSWFDLKSVSAGWAHTAGLKLDGTVVTAGYNGDGRGDTEDWHDMVDVAVGQWHMVGLKSNGRVIAAGCDNDHRTDVDSWREIISVDAGRHHTLGLKADGTAVAVGRNEYGQSEISAWQNLAAICAGGDHTVGLRTDGTVIATGCSQDGQCDVQEWTDIVAVSAGYYHTVGLRSDGTVVATGFNEYGQCNVKDWKDIVAISAGGWHTVGLKADGTVVSTGRNVDRQCETADWSNLLLPRSSVEIG